MASQKLENALKTYGQSLWSDYGRNRLPATIIGAEYGSMKKVDKSGPRPKPMASQLLKALTYVGPFGTRVHGNPVGCCCEVRASNPILMTYYNLHPSRIVFTDPVRPQNGRIIARCANCVKVFGHGI